MKFNTRKVAQTILLTTPLAFAACLNNSDGGANVRKTGANANNGNTAPTGTPTPGQNPAAKAEAPQSSTKLYGTTSADSYQLNKDGVSAAISQRPCNLTIDLFNQSARLTLTTEAGTSSVSISRVNYASQLFQSAYRDLTADQAKADTHPAADLKGYVKSVTTTVGDAQTQTKATVTIHEQDYQINKPDIKTADQLRKFMADNAKTLMNDPNQKIATLMEKNLDLSFDGQDLKKAILKLTKVASSASSQDVSIITCDQLSTTAPATATAAAATISTTDTSAAKAASATTSSTQTEQKAGIAQPQVTTTTVAAQTVTSTPDAKTSVESKDKPVTEQADDKKTQEPPAK